MLLKQEDLPVVINGWGSDEGFAFQVSTLGPEETTFRGTEDTAETPKNHLGYALPRKCITLGYYK